MPVREKYFVGSYKEQTFVWVDDDRAREEEAEINKKAIELLAEELKEIYRNGE